MNSYTNVNDSIYKYKPLLELYDKLMMSSSVNIKNYQSVLEKIFSNVEYILQKILSGIILVDISNNLDQFLLW